MYNLKYEDMFTRATRDATEQKTKTPKALDWQVERFAERDWNAMRNRLPMQEKKNLDSDPKFKELYVKYYIQTWEAGK